MEETNHASLRSYKINIIITTFLPRNVIGGKGKSGQTTIPFPAVIITLAPRMTNVLVVIALVNRYAFHVKIVTMGNVRRYMDIVRLLSMLVAENLKFASPMVSLFGIHARFVPNIRTNFNML